MPRKQSREILYMNSSMSDIIVTRAYAVFRCGCRDTYVVENFTNNFKTLPKLQENLISLD